VPQVLPRHQANISIRKSFQLNSSRVSRAMPFSSECVLAAGG
jgi:hypothetical protein